MSEFGHLQIIKFSNLQINKIIAGAGFSERVFPPRFFKIFRYRQDAGVFREGFPHVLFFQIFKSTKS